jgi:hypothetical protein
MFCGALLGEPPLVAALFASLTIDKTHKAVLKLIPTGQQKVSIHYLLSKSLN